MLAWAPATRSPIGRLGSPKYPMPNVVVHTIVTAMMNAAAAANIGWQRAASHSNSGNSTAIGTTVAHDSRGKNTPSALIAVITTSNEAPSTASFGDGGLRVAAPIPISSGATVRMPSASDANQCSQVVKIGAVEPWNNLNPTVPPT